MVETSSLNFVFKILILFFLVFLLSILYTVFKFTIGNNLTLFMNILNLLVKFSVQYQLNPRLVRGLDYYTSTVLNLPRVMKELRMQFWRVVVMII